MASSHKTYLLSRTVWKIREGFIDQKGKTTKHGRVLFEDKVDEAVFKRILSDLRLKPPVVVKPNWGTSTIYTEAEILDWVLDQLQGDVVVTESYGWSRSKEMLDGKGLGSKKKTDLRESDRWFLEYSGIGKVLKKHNTEFINITEEVWGKRTVEPKEIKTQVERKFQPLVTSDFLSAVPKRLYDLRGGTLLSLAKLRLLLDPPAPSLSIKNLFGMVPGPGRWKYHGKQDSLLAQSIVDINKVYRALFHVKGIVDGVYTAVSPGATARDQTIHEDLGLAWGSESTLDLDAFVSVLLQSDPEEIPYLKLAADNFGFWEDQTIPLAKMSGIHVFPQDGIADKRKRAASPS
jgi:hypothetical protein